MVRKGWVRLPGFGGLTAGVAGGAAWSCGMGESPDGGGSRLTPILQGGRLGRVLLGLGLLLGVAAPAVAADDHAVILEYHHVSADTPPSTSVTPATFKKHLAYLADNGFHVWPLVRILRHLEQGKALPENTVALTFDDAYQSVHSTVMPLLHKRGWPFTVFVSTNYIDKGYGNYMSWDQLRELTRKGADIGNHSRSHPHLARARQGESRTDWLARVRSEVRGAQERLEAEIEEPVRVFAYPFGEFSAPVREVVADMGYFGVGQHSGAVGPATDLTAAPRYPLAGAADMADFATKVRSRSLPVEVLAPADGVLSADAERPVLRLKVPEGPYRLGSLACYASGQGRMAVAWVDREAGVVEARPKKPLGPGRTKYNCTAPSSQTGGVFYWYSYLWMKPRPDGSWYAE